MEPSDSPGKTEKADFQRLAKMANVDLNLLTAVERIALFDKIADTDWRLKFVKGMKERWRQMRSARSRDVGFSLRPAALSSPPPRVAVVVDVDSDDGTGIDGEIWLCRPSGRDPRFVVTEPATYIHEIQASPTGKHLAYVTQPFPPKETRDNTALWVVETGSGRKTLIANGGAAVPTWTPDGSQLLFFRLIGGKWLPYRARSVSQKPELQPASGLNLDQPGSFSGDAQMLAGIVGGQLVVQSIATGQRTVHSLSETTKGTFEWARWSSDSEWVCFALRPELLCGTFSRGIVFRFLLFHPAAGRLVPLDEGLQALAPQEKGKMLTVVTASWMPGTDHRLLLCAQISEAGLQFSREDRKPAHQWVVYDADADAAKQVQRLATQRPGIVFWGADGRHLLIDERIHVIDESF